MTQRICTEPECSAPLKARGLCNAHYLTLRRRGGVPRVAPVPCSVSDCSDVASSRGWCNHHYMLWWRYGDPLTPPRVGHKYQKGDWKEDVGWSGVHNRLRSLYGKASEHTCVDCSGPAREWSYDNADPDERPSAHGPYSLDLSRYAPRCVACHRRFDLGRDSARRRLAEDTLIRTYLGEVGD